LRPATCVALIASAVVASLLLSPLIIEGSMVMRLLWFGGGKLPEKQELNLMKKWV